MSWVYKKSSVAAISLLIIFAAINLYGAVSKTLDQEGYLVRKQLISSIAQDARSHNYPCIAVNYITTPGKNAGYRYFFWWNNLDLITPGNDVAVYSIVNPAGVADKEITFREGAVGVILPNSPKPEAKACTDPNRQLLPLWGFNN